MPKHTKLKGHPNKKSQKRRRKERGDDWRKLEKQRSTKRTLSRELNRHDR
jgi:hypothetical protein